MLIICNNGTNQIVKNDTRNSINDITFSQQMFGLQHDIEHEMVYAQHIFWSLIFSWNCLFHFPKDFEIIFSVRIQVFVWCEDGEWARNRPSDQLNWFRCSSIRTTQIAWTFCGILALFERFEPSEKYPSKWKFIGLFNHAGLSDRQTDVIVSVSVSLEFENQKMKRSKSMRFNWVLNIFMNRRIFWRHIFRKKKQYIGQFIMLSFLNSWLSVFRAELQHRFQSH